MPKKQRFLKERQPLIVICAIDGSRKMFFCQFKEEEILKGNLTQFVD